MPNVAVILGEGGSGGAIAIATANRVLMLEHAIYSVISPEGAASILWRDTAKAQEAATSMKITAQDLVRFGVIDGIVTEPTGGAHRDPQAAIAPTGEAIADALAELQGLDRETVRRQRRDKFLAMGRNAGLTAWQFTFAYHGVSGKPGTVGNALRMPHLTGNDWELEGPAASGSTTFEPTVRSRAAGVRGSCRCDCSGRL